MLLKGALCTGIWPRTRRRLFAGVAVALASCAGAAFAQKKVPATPPPAAHAPIVQFEESKQSRIVYFEESGGMVTRAATPVVPEREEAAPKASRTATNPQDGSTSTGTGTGISAKRTAQQRAAAAAK